MSTTKPMNCYQRGTPMSRRAKRRVVKVYGPVDPKRQAQREASGWLPNQPHALPSNQVQTSVKPTVR